MMAETPTTPPTGFRIDLSPDRTVATLVIEPRAEVSAAAVIAVLKEMKVVGFDDGVVIQSIDSRKRQAVSVAVATGTPAVDARPERIAFRVPVADGVTCTIAKVESGQVIGTLLPVVAGSDGMDVFGQTIAHRQDPPPFQMGRNLSNVKGEIIATARGNLRAGEGTASVEPLLELLDNRDDHSAIVFDGDAFVKGSCSEGRTIELTGSLTVGGAIESVRLKTGGSVHVKGGVIANQKGRLVVGGDLRCRFISGGSIVAAGNVHVQSEIIRSRIACSGRVAVERGAIHGGWVAATGGIVCQVLGHPSGTPTVVEAGEGVTSQSFSASTKAQIEANRKRVSEVRTRIEPLLQQMKLLTSQQREKATELLYEAEELEAATDKMAAELESQSSKLHEKERAEVIVTEIIHSGVIVRFATIETVLSSALRGPLILAPRKSGHGIEIVLIDGTDQSKTVLPSRPIHPNETVKAAQILLAEAA
jgi:uncharacterized protein (DUF342 family)